MLCIRSFFLFLITALFNQYIFYICRISGRTSINDGCVLCFSGDSSPIHENSCHSRDSLQENWSHHSRLCCERRPCSWVSDPYPTSLNFRLNLSQVEGNVLVCVGILGRRMVKRLRWLAMECRWFLLKERSEWMRQNRNRLECTSVAPPINTALPWHIQSDCDEHVRPPYPPLNIIS